MASDKTDDKVEKKENNEGALQPDAETLHTTDPQEHMEGPISSLMQKAEDGFEGEDTEGGEKKKDK